MQQANAKRTTPKRISRQQVEKLISILVDHLDQFDDPDVEPSLGFTESPYNPTQVGPDFCGNANAGDDREVQHDEWEDEDKEPSLGWTESGNLGHPYTWDSDREESSGPVRKPRPKSKTDNNVFRGTAVLGLKEPPRVEECGMVTMKVRRKGAGR